MPARPLRLLCRAEHACAPIAAAAACSARQCDLEFSMGALGSRVKCPHTKDSRNPWYFWIDLGTRPAAGQLGALFLQGSEPCGKFESERGPQPQ